MGDSLWSGAWDNPGAARFDGVVPDLYADPSDLGYEEELTDPERIYKPGYTTCPFHSCYKRRLCTLKDTSFHECGSFQVAWDMRQRDEYKTPLEV